MIEIEKILQDKEEILWKGNPQFKPFIAWCIINPFTISGFIFVIVLSSMFSIAIKSSPEFGLIYFLSLPHIWVAISIVLLPFIYGLLVYKRTHYAVTNKRVIFQTGIIGRDFKSIDFDTISHTEVNVGLLDKLFGKNSGTIYVYSSGSVIQTKNGPIPKPDSISNITDPYNVFRYFSKVSYDVKTDIQYPNKMRPDENTGYNTKYIPPITPPEL